MLFRYPVVLECQYIFHHFEALEILRFRSEGGRVRLTSSEESMWDDSCS